MQGYESVKVSEYASISEIVLSMKYQCNLSAICVIDLTAG